MSGSVALPLLLLSCSCSLNDHIWHNHHRQLQLLNGLVEKLKAVRITVSNT